MGNTFDHSRRLWADEDEESTSAEDSGPFGSLLSTSSEGECADAVVMVCRHWKSKGFCRMGSGCKFSHPEHKCGVSVPENGCAESGRRKKKGSKKRFNKGQDEQLSN